MTLPFKKNYLKDVPIPNFLLEYCQAYPNDDVNTFFLNWAYEQHEKFGETELSLDIMEWDAHSLKQSFQMITTELAHFLDANPRLGDIYKNRPEATYPKEVYQLFRNTPVKEKYFDFGKTYVFIGYVDLLQLVMGVFTGGSGDKVNFYGFDMSEICVARSLIIYEMIKMQLNPNSILEVWFSTGWCNQTLKEFRKACDSVITTTKLAQDINDLINHWRDATLTLNEAINRWQAQFVLFDPLKAISSLLEKQDRIEMCRYELTGQIFGQLKLQCHGNVSMFSMVSHFRRYRRQEGTLLESFNCSEDFKYDGSLLRSVTTYYKSKLQALMKLITADKVKCTLRVMTVQLENKEAKEHIQSLEPHHINWNNVADYIRKESFFKLAYACSNKETTHSMHFMNWSTIVFGTHILQYDEKRLEVHMEQKKVLHGFFMKRHSDGYIPYFRRDAFVIYPLDISNRILALKYRHKFLEYYFDVDEFDVNITDICGPDICNCLQRPNVFTLSFDIKKK
ncbi:uncharacterized protein LOC130629856 [Hydractinia symbiolongicarpus]|uniref:uncharacterized protein LOC130629856 n=1 Tax=Hydractinia symbiolongicarpus TaxID=13093 RepID=UPI002550FDCE|nr:uncharacterized protein LOC130629856 [Hydractinia symbiolongicarpus]